MGYICHHRIEWIQNSLRAGEIAQINKVVAPQKFLKKMNELMHGNKNRTISHKITMRTKLQWWRKRPYQVWKVSITQNEVEMFLICPIFFNFINISQSP